jgi:hypothetical protein
MEPKRLTDTQFKIYMEAKNRIVTLQASLAAAQRELEGISQLILDAHGINPGIRVAVDEVTHNLIVYSHSPAEK